MYNLSSKFIVSKGLTEDEFYRFLILGPPGPPSAPGPVEVSTSAVTLTWKGPEEEEGGLPIMGYFIERSKASSLRWLRMNREPEAIPYEVKDLIEGTDYVFRIIAVNKIGEGEPGPKSKNITAKDPWGMAKYNSSENLLYRIMYNVI